MPLVYILISSKSKEYYKRLFENLIDYSEKQNIEQVAINVI